MTTGSHTASHGQSAHHGHAGHTGGDHGGGEEHGIAHVVPLKILFGVFGALMVLTGVTVGVAQIDLGEFNLIVALIIASIKALLVVMFFMHLWWDKGFNRVAALSSVLFLLLFLGITLMDTHAYQPDIIWKETVLGVQGGAAK